MSIFNTFQPCVSSPWEGCDKGRQPSYRSGCASQWTAAVWVHTVTQGWHVRMITQNLSAQVIHVFNWICLKIFYLISLYTSIHRYKVTVTILDNKQGLWIDYTKVFLCIKLWQNLEKATLTLSQLRCKIGDLEPLPHPILIPFVYRHSVVFKWILVLIIQIWDIRKIYY